MEMIMSRYPFKEGESYSQKYVIDVIERNIRNGTYSNEAAARAWVKQLRKSTHDPIVWAPSTEPGFGRSPMDPNNWRTETGAPIWEQVNVSVNDLP
jgi:hypothetical protein